MLSECLLNVLAKKPLIHNITNYVTANDCANMLLACGASPIMADDPEEADEITSVCQGLNINLGTPNPRKIEAMLIAGEKANELKNPVVFDPVGNGASGFRRKAASDLMNSVKFSVIKGNISEIKSLAKGTFSMTGVDADIRDKVTRENLCEAVRFAKAFSAKTGAIVAITGAIDIVADKDTAYCIYNGSPWMSHVTGTGCMLSALTTAYICANPDNMLERAATAVILMGYAGELAFDNLGPYDGNATYRNRIIDAVHEMKESQLEKGAKYEVR